MAAEPIPDRIGEFRLELADIDDEHNQGGGMVEYRNDDGHVYLIEERPLRWVVRAGGTNATGLALDDDLATTSNVGDAIEFLKRRLA